MAPKSQWPILEVSVPITTTHEHCNKLLEHVCKMTAKNRIQIGHLRFYTVIWTINQGLVILPTRRKSKKRGKSAVVVLSLPLLPLGTCSSNIVFNGQNSRLEKASKEIVRITWSKLQSRSKELYGQSLDRWKKSRNDLELNYIWTYENKRQFLIIIWS